MIIDYTNREIVEKQEYTHDLSISEFNFDFINKELILTGDNYYYNKKLKFLFSNVFYAEVQNDDPWSRGAICQEVNSWELGDSFQTESSGNVNPRSRDCKGVVETVFCFASGNRLTVVCEKINLEEEDIEGMPEWLVVKRREQFEEQFPGYTGAAI